MKMTTIKYALLAVIAILILAIITWLITTSSFFLQFPDSETLNQYLLSRFEYGETEMEDVQNVMKSLMSHREYCIQPYQNSGKTMMGCQVRLERPGIYGELFHYITFTFEDDKLEAIDLDYTWIGL